MIKHYCDCCGREDKKLYPISYLCHIDQILNGDTGVYVTKQDGEMEIISGRWETIDVCIRCYNCIMTSCVKKYRDLKNGFNDL